MKNKNLMSGLAIELIRIERVQRTGKLDLGNCGLMELPNELFDLDWLTELNLSNYYYVENEKFLSNFIDSSNGGEGNVIKDLDYDFTPLQGLKKLTIAFLNISNISFLERLINLEYLDISYNQIPDLSSITYLTKLKTLIANNNTFKNIESVSGLIELEKLDIENNLNIISASVIGELKNLSVLKLSGVTILNIDFLEGLYQLEYLAIGRIGDQIKDLDNLSQLERLKVLELMFNEQVENFSFLSKLRNLEYLNLGYCNVTEISFLESLKKLKQIDLTNNNILDLSPIIYLENLEILSFYDKVDNYRKDFVSLKGLKKLKALFIGNVSLGNVHLLNELGDLEELHLTNSNISDISFVRRFPNLKQLSVGGNKLKDISPLASLKKLELLQVWSNPDIRDFSVISKLANLKYLGISRNNISDTSFLKELDSLEILNISGNNISNIEFLKELKNIKNLSIEECPKIKDFSILTELKKLKSLNLSKNGISDFSFLKNLKRLYSLKLNGNKIKNLSFITKLENIRTLDLRDNRISELDQIKFLIQRLVPISFSEYGSFNNIGLLNNPISRPPIEIVKQGNASVLDWFNATKKELQEIKVILIGEPQAGKTSLLRRLKTGGYSKGEKQTDGINIESINFGEKSEFKNQKSLHGLISHFWDFGGQEIMNSTHKFFLTKRSVYILMLVARNDTDITVQVRQWVKRILVTGGNSPILVVANKIDVNSGFDFKNEYELQNEFPQIKGFVKISCEENINIDRFKNEFEKLVPQAELFHSEIDERWMSIKTQLQSETSKKYFLSESRFLQICVDNKLISRREQLSAINFLNDLGLVLHFQDIDLAEYFVLDPFWITFGVYQILTSKYVAQHKGEISMDKIQYIVNVEKDKEEVYRTEVPLEIYYSTNECRFLVDILNQFKLCYYLSDRKKFIIPDLLEAKEPKEFTLSIRNSDNSVSVIYNYDYLPKSIIPNFIVQAQKIILHSWRTGCIVSHQNCVALISVYENELSLIIDGDENGQQSLLTIIRYIIQSINHDLSHQPDMLIPLPDNLGFVDYEILLGEEQEGKEYHKIYKPKKEEFEIRKLLKAVSNLNKLNLKDLGEKIDRVLLNQKSMKDSFLMQFEMLDKVLINQVSIQEAIKKLSIAEAELLSSMLDEKLGPLLDKIPTMEDIIKIWKGMNEKGLFSLDAKSKLKWQLKFLGFIYEKEISVDLKASAKATLKHLKKIWQEFQEFSKGARTIKELFIEDN